MALSISVGMLNRVEIGCRNKDAGTAIGTKMGKDPIESNQAFWFPGNWSAYTIEILDCMFKRLKRHTEK